jgi:lysophospholipase L1-like esterase
LANTPKIVNLLAIGESTVAGVGASHHAEALGGQLARFLSLETGKSVRWHVLGESGITARETLQRLAPHLPETKMDVVVVALGGNDTFKVSSPNRWRNDMTRLISYIKTKYPNATISAGEHAARHRFSRAAETSEIRSLAHFAAASRKRKEFRAGDGKCFLL